MKIALFIDCENVSDSDLADQMFDELGKIGDVVFRFAYGNAVALRTWNNKIVEYDITGKYIPNVISRGGFKTKNSSDIKITIDVMDMLHAKLVDCIAIASGDSDFLPLAKKIKQSMVSAVCLYSHNPSIKDGGLYNKGLSVAFDNVIPLGGISQRVEITSRARLLLALIEGINSSGRRHGVLYKATYCQWLIDNGYRDAIRHINTYPNLIREEYLDDRRRDKVIRFRYPNIIDTVYKAVAMGGYDDYVDIELDKFFGEDLNDLRNIFDIRGDGDRFVAKVRTSAKNFIDSRCVASTSRYSDKCKKRYLEYEDNEDRSIESAVRDFFDGVCSTDKDGRKYELISNIGTYLKNNNIDYRKLGYQRLGSFFKRHQGHYELDRRGLYVYTNA